jgi:hypothetical protein
MADEDNENTAPSGPPGVSDFDASQFADPAKNFQRRKFLGFSPLLSAAEQTALAGELGLNTAPQKTLVCLLAAPRGSHIPSSLPHPLSLTTRAGWLVDSMTSKTRSLLRGILESLSTDERIRIANEFKRIGWYGSGGPSQALLNGIGYSQDDERAWLKLLDVSNNAQRRWQDVFGLVGSWSSVGGSGPTVRVTSDEDAAAYTREVFLQSLGRMPTRREMAEAANFIRNRERQAAASGQQIPNAGLIAQTFAEKQDPTSRVVFGLGNAIGLAMQALGQ